MASNPLRVLPGKPYPLGATSEGTGVNFSIYSEHATRVDLCLFDGDGPDAEETCVPLREVTGHVWHGFIPNLRPGQRYSYRADGPYDPEQGLRFNHSKLLLDPYAKALTGRVDWQAPVFGYKLLDADADLSCDEQDDARGVPRCVVHEAGFNWGDDRLLRIPWNESIIYEVHVRGFTMQHPEIPDDQRGTYAGLAHPAAIKYLKNLGVTAVELLPVHAYLNDGHLEEKGLHNYWGYNTINYFAPEGRYASAGNTGEQVAEFKGLVKALHAAGIEVILDVVYNHTAEGNQLGPTLSFRGIDNPTYYRLVPDNPRYYFDFTGTGNSLNVRHPQVLQLIMDSLRYWVLEMHVDGFRFDLASTLARELFEVDRLAAFFDIIHQDPVLSQVKLIAEPWDVGEGGYQVGNFPVLWTEWNGKYRDSVRGFWKGDEAQMAEFAYRLAGSPDLYQADGRKPYASINFITAHDGFTLNDLVSYNDKHNEANGEDNRDGHDHNISWNHGIEGPTDDPEIVELRARQQRNFLATLLFSQGVPMLCGGDEIGRSQQGNNNAYCQDNELSWYDWDLDERQQLLLDFTRNVIQCRKDHPILRRRKFFQGRRIRGTDTRDIMWFRADGNEMTDDEWGNSWAKTLGMLLAGQAVDEVDEFGDAIQDDTLLILLNAHHESVPFTLPAVLDAWGWERLLDTNDPAPTPGLEVAMEAGHAVGVTARSLMLLRLLSSQPPEDVILPRVQ